MADCDHSRTDTAHAVHVCCHDALGLLFSLGGNTD